MGRWIIIAGLILVAIGSILQFAPGLLNWLGKLPGDMRFESQRSTVFLPVTSMILISIVLTILINLIRR